jgi:hypothetical protein
LVGSHWRKSCTVADDDAARALGNEPHPQERSSSIIGSDRDSLRVGQPEVARNREHRVLKEDIDERLLS